MVDCYAGATTVEWYPSGGALTYEVTAESVLGHVVGCNGSMAHCRLKGLLCGQRYAVSVRAVGETCSSVAPMMGQLVTGERRSHGLEETTRSAFLSLVFTVYT